MKVAILGLIGAGKDTFATMLQQELENSGRTFVIDRFARPLKELTAKVFSLSLDELEDRFIKEKPVQVPRDVMLDRVFECLVDVLQFNNEELDKASELYFEHFGSARAISPREFQQVFGTDVVRATKPSAWVDYLQAKPHNIIVTDARFSNELCDYNLLVERFREVPKPQHSSEHYAWELQFGTAPHWSLPLDYVNNFKPTTLDELRVQAKKITQTIISY